MHESTQNIKKNRSVVNLKKKLEVNVKKDEKSVSKSTQSESRTSTYPKLHHQM